MGTKLRVLIIEDEALVQLELEMVVADAGHEVVGCAMSSTEAVERGNALKPDLALVDIHLTDGPTGVAVARALAAGEIAVVFMTANTRRIPDDYAGAIGAIAKPYTASGIVAALTYLAVALRSPTPPGPPPSSLTLAPATASSWNQRPG